VAAPRKHPPPSWLPCTAKAERTRARVPSKVSAVPPATARPRSITGRPFNSPARSTGFAPVKPIGRLLTEKSRMLVMAVPLSATPPGRDASSQSEGPAAGCAGGSRRLTSSRSRRVSKMPENPVPSSKRRVAAPSRRTVPAPSSAASTTPLVSAPVSSTVPSASATRRRSPNHLAASSASMFMRSFSVSTSLKSTTSPRRWPPHCVVDVRSRLNWLAAALALVTSCTNW